MFVRLLQALKKPSSGGICAKLGQNKPRPKKFNTDRKKYHMTSILIMILTFFGSLLILLLFAGLIALAAYGLGLLLNLLMGFDPFQVTIFALASLVVAIVFIERLLKGLLNLPSSSQSDDDEDYDDEDEEYEDDEPLVFVNPRIPRWRQPLKQVDFTNAKPDDRCPCGSRRKYKNCHGATKT
jgi:hypothetical protein